ncbi:MAG TPA: hypothetical protein VMX55_04530 [candidate division Zixibacteria bacterium]|nr:hypothetical protein [candidate division Zixibacteria bacterium]
MYSKRISAVIVILAIMTIASVQSFGLNFTSAISNPTNTSDDFQVNDDASEIVLNKKIVTRNNDLVDFYESYVNETFTVIIEITNNAINPIYNVTMTCPEIDVEAMNDSYDSDWFTFQGDRTKNFTQINAGQTVSASYSVTPHHEYNFYSFNPTNLTYSWDATRHDISYSNKIAFVVYEEYPHVRIKKYLTINGKDAENGRIAVDEVFNIKIIITNFEYVAINLTLIDSAPGIGFEYNTSELNSSKNMLLTNQTYSYSYGVVPIVNDTYVFGVCEVNVTYTNDTRKLTYINDNIVTLTVYQPDYTGNDWTKIIPLLSIKKYFAIWDEEDQSYNYFTEYSVYNHTSERIMIFINITNIGEITAYNLTIEEQEYQDWVFETDNIDEWIVDELRQGENISFNYYITAKIVGDFKIEPSKITYTYKNPRTMLYIDDQLIFSNVIVIHVTQLIPEPDLTKQWWIAVGITMGIIFIAVIPTIITFYSYKGKRRTQKGT